MNGSSPRHVLTINSGSSSVKFALYAVSASESLTFSGAIDRIGLAGSTLAVRNAEGRTLIDEHRDLADHDAAIRALLEWLRGRMPKDGLDAVGHRLVHGGDAYRQPTLITPEVETTLEGFVRLAPNHLPHALEVIRVVGRHYPDIRQVACFDTAFHRHMPEVAQRYPMPRSLWHEGVRRYGFHGLSYEYILQELERQAGVEIAHGRVIVAHLGNGASMAAVCDGVGIETTMGLTPAGGMMMGTRSGDLDPGVLLYLLREKQRSPSTLDYLVYERAGLIGVSGSTSDMRDLLRREPDDPHAAEAVAMFCYYAKKSLGALAAVLGGLDTLVFTAGVGENAPTVRRRICEGLEFLGIAIDPAANERNGPIISRQGAAVTVRVMRTDEQLMIARHTCAVIGGEGRGTGDGEKTPTSAPDPRIASPVPRPSPPC